MTPGSDIANLTILGYDTKNLYPGRGPLEAANMGVELGPQDIAFRCNLVTLSEDPDRLCLTLRPVTLRMPRHGNSFPPSITP